MSCTHPNWIECDAKCHGKAVTLDLSSPAALAGVPTSLLLRDVLAHACDRYDRDQLCDRCRGKWEEIDRRMPARTGQP